MISTQQPHTFKKDALLIQIDVVDLSTPLNFTKGNERRISTIHSGMDAHIDHIALYAKH